MKKFFLLLFTGMLLSFTLHAQDLLNLIEDTASSKQYTQATFKTVRLVVGKSVENVPKGNLLFTISHHFGQINQGAYNFFGLDMSTIRLGFEYGISNRLDIGIGRAEYEKTYDAFLKFKLLRQQTGRRLVPLTVSFMSDIDVFTLKWMDPGNNHFFSDRLCYTQQLLIARKFSESVSLQLMPTLVHKNLVRLYTDKNDIWSVGGGGRVKITKRISINLEYYYLLPGNTAVKNSDNPLSVGFDIETGGHVFQLFFTNTQYEFERAFITETSGKWKDKFIYFGFNINRIFTISGPRNW